MSSPTVYVYDTNREALARRVLMVQLAAPGVRVESVASRNAALLLAASAEPGSLFLVDLCVTDRFTLDRPGERLIRRLARHPRTAKVRALAWSAHIAPDVVQGVRDAGGLGFVTATLEVEQERAELARAIAGEHVWPEQPAAGPGAREAWTAWFETQFMMPWEPWVEPMLVRLAGGEERRAVVDELVESGAALSRNHAASRLRDVARAVAGEHSNSPSTVASRAALALSQIAAHRPLTERPSVAVSLEHGARAIEQAPSLAEAAGLTADEVDEITALHGLITAKRLGSSAGAGAPPADKVRLERRWAAGRRAMAYGADRTDVDAVIDGILARTEEALTALDDARQDELYHPEARAGVALGMLTPAEAEGVDGVEMDGDRLTWRGDDALALARNDRVSVADVRALFSAVDAIVLRRTARPVAHG